MWSGMGEALRLSLIGAFLCLGLFAGALAVYVYNLPGFNGWANAYDDIVHHGGHGLHPDMAAPESGQ